MYLCGMDIDNKERTHIRRLKDFDILEPFMEYLQPTCVNIKLGESLVIYRTQDEIPVDDYGQSPRPRRKMGGNAINQRLTEEEIKALPQKKREKIMGEWGLSCNNTEEAALQSFLFTYQRLEKRGASKEDLESFVHDRGRFICRYKITNETGLITPFDAHGHANLYLYEGVNLEDYRDKEYNYTPIDYQKDEK